MFIGGKLLLQFVLLQSFIVLTLCCVCFPKDPHPQKAFCRYRFVMRVRVIGNSSGKHDIDGGVGLSVQIEEVYKGGIQVSVVNLIMNSECKLDLKIGETWLIYAYKIEDKIFFTSICSGSRLWSDTWEFYRQGLDKFYKQACDCWPGKSQTQDKCAKHFSFYEIDETGLCTFNKNENFEKCLKNRHQNRFYHDYYDYYD